MKCEVFECTNEEYQGAFEGNVCKPCYAECLEAIAETVHSQARRNMQEEAKSIIKLAEHYKIDEKYK